jgi:ATP-dependent DNA ligase
MPYRPMPLVRIPEHLDHPDWLFELKHDGFRALAVVEGHCCRLVSRRGHTVTWTLSCEEIAHSVRANACVLDGELVCLDSDGRSHFYTLMFRCDWPSFFAFDLGNNKFQKGNRARNRPASEGADSDLPKSA